MTGPEHYARAERLIAGVTMDGTHPDSSAIIRNDEPETIAAAQVHATLALAAATALKDGDEGMGSSDYNAWVDAASEWKRTEAAP
jgi:hypothetical protein